MKSCTLFSIPHLQTCLCSKQELRKPSLQSRLQSSQSLTCSGCFLKTNYGLVMAATTPARVTKQGGWVSPATCSAPPPQQYCCRGQEQGYHTYLLQWISTCTVRTVLRECATHCTHREHSTSPSKAGNDPVLRQAWGLPHWEAAWLVQTLARESGLQQGWASPVGETVSYKRLS